MHFSPEHTAFLRALLRGRTALWPPGSAALERDFVRAVEYHGAAGIVRAALQAQPTATVPPEVASAIEAATVRTAARNRLRAREAADVLDGLRDAGVRAVALKGLALLAGAYEHLGLRPMTDLDLLVAPSDLPAADGALQLLGYRRGLTDAPGRVHHWTYYRDSSGVDEAVEIHRRLFAAPPLDELVQTEDLLRRARPVDWTHGHVEVLSGADSLLHIAGHLAVQHAGFERLIWVADADRAVRAWPGGVTDEAWRGLWDQAREWRLAPALADVLTASKCWFDTPVVLAPCSVSELAEYATMRGRAPVGLEGAKLAHDLGASASWRDRAARLREAAVPAPSYMREWYGLENGWRLPAAYVRRWANGVSDVVEYARRRERTPARGPESWMVADANAPVAGQTPSSLQEQRVESEPLS